MKCPKCGSRVIFEIGIYLLTLGGDQRVWYECFKCKYKWEEIKD